MNSEALRFLRVLTRQFMVVAPTASVALVIMGVSQMDRFRPAILLLHGAITLSAVSSSSRRRREMEAEVEEEETCLYYWWWCGRGRGGALPSGPCSYSSLLSSHPPTAPPTTTTTTTTTTSRCGPYMVYLSSGRPPGNFSPISIPPENSHPSSE